jgi:hypothetical protein
MHTAYLDLNSDAESAHEPFGAAWIDAMRMAVEIATGSAEGLELLSTKWRNPATPTIASQADATSKLVAAGVLPADSAVTLELMGFDQTTIDRIVADRRRAEAGSRLQQVLDAARQAAPAQVEPVEPDQPEAA